VDFIKLNLVKQSSKCSYAGYKLYEMLLSRQR